MGPSRLNFVGGGGEDFGGATEYWSVMTGTRTALRWPAAGRLPLNADAAGTAGGGVSFGTLSGGNQTRGVTTEGSGAT